MRRAGRGLRDRLVVAEARVRLGGAGAVLAGGDLLAGNDVTWSHARMLGDLGPLSTRYASGLERRLTERPGHRPV